MPFFYITRYKKVFQFLKNVFLYEIHFLTNIRGISLLSFSLQE